jgi:serine O-acetyltransferase
LIVIKFQEWLENTSGETVGALLEKNAGYFIHDHVSIYGIKSKVVALLNKLITVLFPGIFEIEPCLDPDLLAGKYKTAANELNQIILSALVLHCREEKEKGDPCGKCIEKAYTATTAFLSGLPAIRDLLNTDIDAGYDGDPAARSKTEIMLSYPFFDAVAIYRMAHKLYTLEIPLVPRIMTEYAHQITGIDIHPGATIGSRFFIDHGTGVVIGETCVIGSNVKLYQGVTLGAKSFKLDESGNPVKGIKRHPNIEDNVVIYAGATILGGETVIGHDSVIGGNVWLMESVPPYSTVYNKLITDNETKVNRRKNK